MDELAGGDQGNERKMTSTNTAAGAGRLRLEIRPVAQLTPSARNARTHSKSQIAEIAASITAFGFTNPILVGPDSDVIAGHGRLAAARLLGLSEVPVIVLNGLTELQQRQLMLADNRISLNSGWDLEILAAELTDLSVLGADLAVLGFTKAELAKALTPACTGGLTGEDESPELSEKPVTVAGDIWQAGPHRIGCADSTDAAAVTALLNGLIPGLMVTDPPYGVNYDPEWRHRAGVNKSARRGKVLNDDQADWGTAWALFPGNIAYIWHGALHSTTVADSLVTNGFTIRAQIIWAKDRMVLGRGDYHWAHEPCFYAVRDKGNWTGDRKQTTLWNIASGAQDTKTTHGTQKPVECMRRPMLNNSSPGQAVYDPFTGSGSSLIAAETTGRVCLGMELEPRYVDVAVRRWQAFTGMAACLAGDARSFDVVAAQRLSALQNTNPGPAAAQPVEIPGQE